MARDGQLYPLIDIHQSTPPPYIQGPAAATFDINHAPPYYHQNIPQALVLSRHRYLPRTFSDSSSRPSCLATNATFPAAAAVDLTLIGFLV